MFHVIAGCSYICQMNHHSDDLVSHQRSDQFRDPRSHQMRTFKKISDSDQVKSQESTTETSESDLLIRQRLFEPDLPVDQCCRHKASMRKSSRRLTRRNCLSHTITSLSHLCHSFPLFTVLVLIFTITAWEVSPAGESIKCCCLYLESTRIISWKFLPIIWIFLRVALSFVGSSLSLSVFQ